jgi:hypothetical protein
MLQVISYSSPGGLAATIYKLITQTCVVALLYWDPDGISGNNVLSTGAGLGGSGSW